MHLPDDIVGAILDRIDSHVSLIRAASTCRRWRSIIADAAFLRRFRSLHAPAVAGDYCNYSPLPPFKDRAVRKTRDPVFFIPSPSSSSTIDARHFSLDFLPDDGVARRLVDSRGSLLLMHSHSRIGGAIVDDLVVCEPLTRRYKRVLPPPELTGATATFCFRQFYLIDGAGTSNFRVLSEYYMDNSMHIVVFKPDDDGGGREDYSSSSWKEKDISSSIVVPAGLSWARELGRAAGSWYFYDTDEEDRISNMLIALDGRTGEFSTSMLPANENWAKGSTNFCVADGHDGKPRVCTVGDGIMKVFAMRGGKWALEKRLLLEEAVRGLPGYKPWYIKCLKILTRGAGFIILLLMTALVKWTVSVDLETMEVAPGVEDMGPMVYRCELPWPPVLNACLDKRA